jgi:general secretion pathway protein A
LYLSFFGLNEAPFSITPDPAFVYLSVVHRDALAHLIYGVGQGGASGFVQLTGEVGTGKTTLCRCLMEQVPENTRVALLLNPLVTPRELLATICEELDIDTSDIADSNKAMVDSLNQYLLKQHIAGRRVVVVIDEAQNLSPEALEQVRLLTNLETDKDKLLQMVLLGQPELRQLLQRQNLRQLSQRITARYHLMPLGQDETQAYVRHRMEVAGASRNPFGRRAMRVLYQRSAGVPRLINIIADRALTGAYSKEAHSVNAKLIHEAANEVQPSEARVRSNHWPWAISTAAAVALLVITIGLSGIVPFKSGSEPFRVESEPRSAGSPAESLPEPAALPSTGLPEPEVSPYAHLPEPDGSLAEAEAESLIDDPAGIDAIGGVNESGILQPDPKLLPATLDNFWLDNQHEQAWQALADLWQDGERANDMQSACDGVEGTGYACLRDHGSWARVQQLGLPALIVLQGEDTRFLLLRGMTPDGLLLGSEDSPLEVSRQAVENQWLGEFIVLWPQAPDWPGQVRRGESGAAVDIIMQMAAFADPAWHGGGVFDENFELWLVAFQKRHGLKADGIVGPNTLLYLLAPTITSPRLVTEADESS